MIFFDEPSHTYRLDDPISGELCISVTTLIGLFKQKYDSVYWSYYTGLRYALEMEKKEFSKFLIVKHKFNFGKKGGTTKEKVEIIRQIARRCGVSDEEVRENQRRALFEWKQKNLHSQAKGTNFHYFKETGLIKEAGEEYNGVFAKTLVGPTDLSSLNDDTLVVIPEIRLYDRRFKVSGSGDKTFIYPNKVFDMDDYKTNEEIKTENKYDKMQYPLHHLDDCNYNHYRLQISTYAWILEQWGYTPRELKFTHVVINEDNSVLESTEYRFDYMKKEVEDMLNYYDVNREKLIERYYKEPEEI